MQQNEFVQSQPKEKAMGVFTFVCKQSATEWSAKQLKGDIESSGDSTFDLQRKLVQLALSADSSGPVQSSFTYVTPTSAVFQVVVGGNVGGSFVASAAPAASSSGGDAPPAEEKKKEEPEEESDEEPMGGLFDDDEY